MAMTFTGVVTATFAAVRFASITALAYYGTSSVYTSGIFTTVKPIAITASTVPVTPTTQVVLHTGYELGWGWSTRVQQLTQVVPTTEVRAQPIKTGIGYTTTYAYPGNKFSGVKEIKVNGYTVIFNPTPNDYLGTVADYFAGFTGYTKMLTKDQQTVEPYYGSRRSAQQTYSFWS